MASADAVLTPDEKELGVVLIDIGGGTTDVAIFTEGAIRHTAVIPIAGDQITNDIAMALRTPTAEAEEIKLRYGVAKQVLADPRQQVEVPGLGDRDPRTLSRQALAAVIEPRVEEIVRTGAPGGARVGLRGSPVVRHGADRRHLDDAGHGRTGRGHLPQAGAPRHAGVQRPAGRRVRSPRYATVLGLLLEAKKQYLRGHIVTRQEGSVKAVWQRMKEWFLGNF